MNPYEEYAQRGYFVEPHTALNCTNCDCCITDGEDYFEVDGDEYCELCFDEHLSELKSDARRTAGE